MARTRKPTGLLRLGETQGELRQPSTVEALAVSGDGRHVYTGDDKGVIRRFDAATGACVQRKPPAAALRPRREVVRLTLSADGGTLAVQYRERLWTLDTATFTTDPGRLPRLPEYLTSALSPDGRTVACGSAWGVDLVDVATGASRRLAEDGDGVHAIAFTAGGDVVTVARGRHLRRRDRHTGAVLAEAAETGLWSAPPRSTGTAVEFFGDAGNAGAVLSADGLSIEPLPDEPALVEWDGGSAPPRRRPLAAVAGRAVPLLAAGALAVGREDRDATVVLDAGSGQARGELPGRRCRVAVSADGKVLVSANGVTIERYDATTLAPLGSAGAGLSTHVAAVAFEPGGGALWTGDQRSARRWSLPGGACTATVETGGPVQRLTPDAAAALVVRPEGAVVLALPAGRPLGPALAARHRMPGLAPDGRHLASIGAAGVGVQVWDVVTGTARELPEDGRAHPYAIAYSYSGRLIAAGRSGRVIHVWEDGTVAARFTAPGQPPLALAVAPDETMLAIGADERPVWLVDLPSGRLRHRLDGHTRREVWAVAFSPDGTLLASSDGRDVRLWDTATGAQAGVARVGAGALSFSADGRLLAAGGEGAAWVIEVELVLD